MTFLSRKEFINITKNFLAFLGLGAIAGPIVAYFFPAKLEDVPLTPVSAGSEDELPVNTSKKVSFGRYPALVIHTDAGLRAYSAVCTHFACITDYDPQQEMIVCPCHDGFFDPLDGSVISGPPPAPLTPLKVEVIDGIIYISAGEEA